MDLFKFYEDFSLIKDLYYNYSSIDERPKNGITILETVKNYNDLFKESVSHVDSEKSEILSQYYKATGLGLCDIIHDSINMIYDEELSDDLFGKYILFPNWYARIALIKHKCITKDILTTLTSDADYDVRDRAKNKLEYGRYQLKTNLNIGAIND
jgi:hypothetical protein